MIFHRVKKISPLPDKVLLAEFEDGIKKLYDVKPLKDKLPVFSMLDYVAGLFEQVYVDAGGYGIVWNDELDLSCDELYNNGEILS